MGSDQTRLEMQRLRHKRAPCVQRPHSDRVPLETQLQHTTSDVQLVERRSSHERRRWTNPSRKYILKRRSIDDHVNDQHDNDDAISIPKRLDRNDKRRRRRRHDHDIVVIVAQSISITLETHHDHNNHQRIYPRAKSETKRHTDRNLRRSIRLGRRREFDEQ